MDLGAHVAKNDPAIANRFDHDRSQRAGILDFGTEDRSSFDLFGSVPSPPIHRTSAKNDLRTFHEVTVQRKGDLLRIISIGKVQGGIVQSGDKRIWMFHDERGGHAWCNCYFVIQYFADGSSTRRADIPNPNCSTAAQ